MWDLPRGQSRDAQRLQEKNRQDEHERRNRLIHIKRAGAELAVSEGIASRTSTVGARLVLNEFRTTGVYLFTQTAFYPGQKVSLILREPKTFYISGTVMGCQPVTLSKKIISITPYPYRIRLDFNFQSDEERKAVREFYEELHFDYLTTSEN